VILRTSLTGKTAEVERFPGDTLSLLRSGLAEAMGRAVESIEIDSARRRTYSRIFFCRVGLKDGSRQAVVVKLYQPWKNSNRADLEGLLVRDFEITSFLHRLFGTRSRFLVPAPLFHSPEHLLIVTAHMPGVQLQEKLKARSRWFPGEATARELEADCQSCGEWLREFQALTRPVAGGPTDVEGITRTIAQRLEWCVDSGHIPVSAAQRKLILSYVDRLIGALRSDDLAVSGVHGDFFAGNLLVSPGRVVGLDFVMYREGSIYADPSYFVFQLETLGYKPSFRASTVARLRAAFLRGYERTLPSEDFFSARPMLRLYYVFHQVMRLGRMLVLKDAPLHRRLYNRLVASASVSRLCELASRSAGA
jgi:hypothetical protein